jgi:hypothetical protein
MAGFYSWAGAGGAIDCFGASFPSVSSFVIRNNVIANCSSSGFEGELGVGGAIGISCSSGVIEGNTIYGCKVGSGGVAGGIWLYSSSGVMILRNIIAGCTGQGIYSEDDVPPISCNDVWNNSPSNYGGTITDQTGVNGNVSLDPMFCDPVAGNFFLNSGSPCLNATSCGSLGALPMGCGATPIEETTWGRVKTLFR